MHFEPEYHFVDSAQIYFHSLGSASSLPKQQITSHWQHWIDSNYDNSVIWVTLILLIIIFLFDALNSPKSTVIL